MSIKGIAPCGHAGTYYTANYVRCDQGCDAAHPTAVPVERRCPKCGSTNIARFVMFGAAGTWHCWVCGTVFTVKED